MVLYYQVIGIFFRKEEEEMKIFLTFIFVVAIATLGVMNGNIQAADEQKAEAVASTVEHPKGSILRLSTQNQKRD